MEELHCAMRSMPSNSAPGTDGLTAGFYAVFLDTLGEALLTLVNAILEHHMKPNSFGAGRDLSCNVVVNGSATAGFSYTRGIRQVKVLGIFFSCEGVAETTWQKAVERAHLATARTRRLDLTLREKALAAKTSIWAFANYASRVAVMPAKTASQLNKMISSVLWDDKPAPVKRNLLQLPEGEGGLGLPHVTTISRVLALKTVRFLHQTSDFYGKGLLLYWSSTNTKYLDADRQPGPLAEFPSPFYKTAANTKRMLDKQAACCDIDKDPPVRIAETITRNQLSADESRKTKTWRRKKGNLSRGLPREVHDFMWKNNWKVLPSKQRLHKFGIVPSARCPNCRAEESAEHALFECTAAKPVWRLVAKDFGIRLPPAHGRNRGAFARLVIACMLFVIWKRRCVAVAKKTHVRAAYPAVSRIRRLLWSHLSEELEAGGEEKFLRRWHTKFFFVKDGKPSLPIIPY
ncbi:hypothetical protein HPB52_007149 [Rhipicephalus sanguineus]|uniref:Reverse transcriptase zinc-binding domain-containing protein n=1 Tax=Rhipicephalus sanguineus TaxID=34632 RepID=A0A9D4PIA6_RHISA|nr:hypothetical protein HPB52_007149 [Rhipicephalus sanguineus]